MKCRAYRGESSSYATGLSIGIRVVFFPFAIQRNEGEGIMSLESITQQVREEVEKLSRVLHLLEGGTNQQARKQVTTNGRKKKRKLSAAGRASIAAAQRARWAKIRAGK